MNTSRRSSSWQEGQFKVWCSKPGTVIVSSGTVCTKRISPPHTMQRITRTHADWRVSGDVPSESNGIVKHVNGMRLLCVARSPCVGCMWKNRHIQSHYPNFSSAFGREEQSNFERRVSYAE
jgi:hypothetical protein